MFQLELILSALSNVVHAVVSQLILIVCVLTRLCVHEDQGVYRHTRIHTQIKVKIFK